jgi:hypothetical protein
MAEDKVGGITAVSKDTFSQFDYAMASRAGKTKANLERDTHTNGINDGEYTLAYKNVDSYHESMIQSSSEYYAKVSLLKNIVDMLGDFASEEIVITHKNKTVDDFYKQWAKKVRLQSRINTFMTEFYKSGNVFVWRVNGKLSRVANRGNSDIEIPVAYRAINPRAIKIEGDEFLGTRRFFLTNTTSAAPSTINDVSDNEFGKDRGVNNKSSNGIELDADRIFSMQYKKSDWNKWAQPLIYATLADIDFKLKLREMDKAAMDSIINVITLFKIGSDEYPPTRALFEKLASIVESSNPSMNLLWDNNLTVEQKHLPVDEILGKEKYDQIDNDILAGIGVPKILINGDGANFANSFLQVKTTAEKIKLGQEFSIEFVERETAYLADMLGFRTYPEVSIESSSLRDEIQEKKTIISAVDRRLISRETGVRKLGENPNIEFEKIKNEAKLEESGELPAYMSPFTGKDMSGGEGKPQNPTGPNEKDRIVPPKGLGLGVEGDVDDDQPLEIDTEIPDNQTEAPAKLDRCVVDVKSKEIERYKKRYGKDPDKKAMKKIERKAWAICQSSINGK